MILPEDKHKSGVPYRWINLDVLPPTPLPSDIATMIMARPAASNGSSGDLASTAEILNGVPEGERDETLFRLACRLRRQLGDDSRRIVELAIVDAAATASRRSQLIKRCARLSRLGGKITAIEYLTS